MSARKPPQNNIHRILLLTILPFILLACATTPTSTSTSGSKNQSPASKLYSEGKDALAAGKFDVAISKFSSLEALYPGDSYAQQAQMELAYAYHKNGDATSAIATADRFIRNNPTHANVDYAYYLRGLTSFELAIEQLSSESVQATQRRPLMAQLSLQYLSELIDKFPDSKYSSDAARRITFLKDKLAQYEVMLAKNDLDNGAYANAALHAKAAIENYPQAPAIPEAASITNEAYKMLKLENPDTRTASETGMRNVTVTGNATLDELPAPDAKEPVIIPFKAKETPRNQQSPPAKKPAAVTTTVAAEQAVGAVTPETPTPAPVPAGETTTQSANGIHQDAWILAQDPASYTIQLLGTGNEKLLVALIERLNLTDKAAYYRNASLDRPWYALTYGTYSSASEANEAINQLPDELLKGQPWIRKYGAIQSLIKVQ